MAPQAGGNCSRVVKASKQFSVLALASSVVESRWALSEVGDCRKN